MTGRMKHGRLGLALGLALASIARYLPGSVVVLGTPAEESTVDNSGGKVHLIRAGELDDVAQRCFPLRRLPQCGTTPPTSARRR